ncbi:hypothetical protein [Vreelandella nanhaiensis]|uniref:Fis family transcriptional regulator n=1 Tax=Vreelandella nanhaiensis TaxID=1258546 RepID=A0A433KTT4_9GAMM|nr:hypothetical protein [Halomonas nanhaiensis]RUR33102.1 hypothetical protein ELY38_05995 [Halomonas nanhaiensis]
MIAKRERGKMERQLGASLTDACEQAKADVPGFVWLTHCVDYQHFPESLVVIWVFDTDAHLALALKGDAKQRLYELTASALAEAGVALDSVTHHIDFDSEQACKRAHDGDWQRRLRSRTARH